MDMSTGVIRAGAMMGREMERATKVGFSEKMWSGSNSSCFFLR
jgi:hypothetical protein